MSNKLDQLLTELVHANKDGFLLDDDDDDDYHRQYYQTDKDIN